VEIPENTKLGNNIREKVGLASARENIIILFLKIA